MPIHVRQKELGQEKGPNMGEGGVCVSPLGQAWGKGGLFMCRLWVALATGGVQEGMIRKREGGLVLTKIKGG